MTSPIRTAIYASQTYKIPRNAARTAIKRLSGLYTPKIIRICTGLSASRFFQRSHHSNMKHFAKQEVPTTKAISIPSSMKIPAFTSSFKERENPVVIRKPHEQGRIQNQLLNHLAHSFHTPTRINNYPRQEVFSHA